MDANSRAALDQYVRTEGDALLRYGYALTGDTQRAADLVQEALVRVAARWSRLDAHQQLDRYVRRVMANQRVTWWRRTRREVLTDAVPEVTGKEPGASDVKLQKALMCLPRGQRAMIALRYLEDLSEVQVAEVLGCSVGNVKSQTAHGLTKLRAQLEREKELI